MSASARLMRPSVRGYSNSMSPGEVSVLLLPRDLSVLLVQPSELSGPSRCQNLGHILHSKSTSGRGHRRTSSWPAHLQLSKFERPLRCTSSPFLDRQDSPAKAN